MPSLSPSSELKNTTPDEWNERVLRNRVGGGAGVGTSCCDLDLEEMNFSNRLILGLDFSRARIHATQFRQSNIRLAKFTNCELRDVNFSGAILYQVDFSGARFDGVNFGDAQIHSCNFLGTSVSDTLLRGTIICPTSLATICSKRPGILVRRVRHFLQRCSGALGEPYSWMRRPVVTLVLRFVKI